MRRRLPVIALCALLSVSGCGSKAEPPSATNAVSTAPSPHPSAAESYDTAQRLVGGLNEAGIACLNWERTDNPVGALERGSCFVGTEEVIASIYGSHEDAQADVARKDTLLQGVSEVNVVVGGNWALSCDSQALCIEIGYRFGGLIHHVST